MPNDLSSTPGPSSRAGEEQRYEREELATWLENSAKHEWDITASMSDKAMLSRIAQLLRAAAQGGEGDTRRLDWVEELDPEIQYLYSVNEGRTKGYELWFVDGYEGPSLRDAIDAAMKQSITATRRSPDHGEGK